MTKPADYAGKTAYRGPIAEHYDRDRVGEAIWQVEQQFVTDWTATLSPGQGVLDVPAGTGRFTEAFLARGLQVHAMDISDDMLAPIRRRWPAATPGLTVQAADAERLPLADGAVDCVLSWRLFHLLPAPVYRRVLQEFHRVARREVVLQVFAVRPAGQPRPFAPGLRRKLGPTWRRLRAALGGPPVQPWSHIASFSHGDDEIRQAIAAAGLVVARVHDFGADAAGLLNRVYFLTRAGDTPAQGRA